VGGPLSPTLSKISSACALNYHARLAALDAQSPVPSAWMSPAGLCRLTMPLPPPVSLSLPLDAQSLVPTLDAQSPLSALDARGTLPTLDARSPMPLVLAARLRPSLLR
jgi:hypothetical protein